MKISHILFALIIAAPVFGQTKFGVLINGRSYTAKQKAAIAKDSLHVAYVRDAIIVQNFMSNPQDRSVEANTKKGLKIILNINWGQGLTPFQL